LIIVSQQRVNESQPSYGKQIGDITLDNTNYVIKISNDCKSKIEDNLPEKLFELYWSMGNYSRRAAYISKLIMCSDKISSRKRRDTPDKQKPKKRLTNIISPRMVT